LNSIGAIIIAVFAVIWIAAGANQLGRRWFLALLAFSIMISAAIGFAAFSIPFGKHSGGSMEEFTQSSLPSKSWRLLAQSFFSTGLRKKDF
jgi:hypothetical protein